MAEGGVLLTLPASAALSLNTMKSARIVVDNWKMYEAYAQELRGLPGGYAANLSGICGYLMDLVEGGEIPQQEHRQPGRCDCPGSRRAAGTIRSGSSLLWTGCPLRIWPGATPSMKTPRRWALGPKLNLWEKDPLI